MKQIIKRATAIILAVLIVFCSATVAFAKESVTPVIMVPGLGSTALYKDPGTDDQKEVGFDIGSILSVDLISNVLHIFNNADVDFEELMNELTSAAGSFTDFACDENGDSLNNVGIANFWDDSLDNHPDYLTSRPANEPAIVRQITDEIGPENVYILNYDWRMDVCDTADKLNELVTKVKADKGVDKVTLVSGSLGTSVVSAYIDEYGTDSIKRSVFIDGALQGVDVTRAYEKDIYFDADEAMEYFKEVKDVYQSDEVDLNAIYQVLSFLKPQLKNACNYLNSIVDDKEKIDRIYNEVILPVIGNIPSLWECIPYDEFDNCVKTIKDMGFLDESSGLYAKIQNYHNVQGRCRDNLKKFADNGGEIAVVANYAVPGIPVTSMLHNETDILIDLKYTSIGATIADHGEEVEGYGEYISADRQIDASTALFPDNTWYVKNILHMNYAYGTEATKFVAYLATSEEAPTYKSVKSALGYNRFLEADSEQNIVKSEFAIKKLELKKSPGTGYDNLLGAFALCALSAACIYLASRKKEQSI